MSQEVLSITQLNTYIRDKMDRDLLLCNLAVRGEISNYKVYPSGHHYFTLKDDQASLRCVMFKGNTFRLRFRPENGMNVIALGKVSVYPRDGAYQLYCTSLTADGAGDLYVAFEQLKAKLSAKGLFDPSRKKPIPRYPTKIGIVTSPAGAAIHDMLRILKARYPLATVKIFPVRVQGSEAPAEIAGAIQFANYHQLADLLIVGRGGGSMEDLWAFNDESVAQAIYESTIPVISAVGHEPDVTISDYVADLRAATPSNAAELAVPDQDALRQSLDSIAELLSSLAKRRLTAARRQWDVLSASNTLKSPHQYIEILTNALKLSQTRLISAQNQMIHKRRQSFVATAAKLDAMSPLKVIGRGYAIASSADGTVLRSVSDVETDDVVNILLKDGVLCASVTEKKGNTHEQATKDI